APLLLLVERTVLEIPHADRWVLAQEAQLPLGTLVDVAVEAVHPQRSAGLPVVLLQVRAAPQGRPTIRDSARIRPDCRGDRGDLLHAGQDAPPRGLPPNPSAGRPQARSDLHDGAALRRVRPAGPAPGLVLAVTGGRAPFGPLRGAAEPGLP